MHVAFELEPQWLTFAAGLVFGTAAAAAIAYGLVKQRLAGAETPRSKVKASRYIGLASTRLTGTQTDIWAVFQLLYKQLGKTAASCGMPYHADCVCS